MISTSASTLSALPDADSICFTEVGVRYPGMHVQALSDISLTVARRSFVSFIGPSGSGKSTLMAVAVGLQATHIGEISVCGYSPQEATKRKMLGYVPQTSALLPWLTAEGNVRAAQRINRSGRSMRQCAQLTPADYLGLVGLSDSARKYPHQLSGGMRQRVSIARAFAIEPEVLVMDEPFSALDEFTREALQLQLLKLYQDIDTTVLFVTHSIREAVVLSDRIVVMSARPGKIHEIIDVPLPRPRSRDVVKQCHLHELEDRVRLSLEDAWLCGAKPDDLVPVER